MILVHRKKIFV